MTDFSDCIAYIDRIKVEFNERFRYLLEVNEQLENKIEKSECKMFVLTEGPVLFIGVLSTILAIMSYQALFGFIALGVIYRRYTKKEKEKKPCKKLELFS